MYSVCNTIPVLFILACLCLAHTVVSPAPSNGDVTLNGTANATTAGPLRVYYDGEFLSVCAVGFNQVAADTACVQLGYSRAINYSTIANPPSDDNIDVESGDIFVSPIFSIVSCSSRQSHILRCNYTVLSSPSECDHSNDVYLTCDSNRPRAYSGDVRLYNGTFSSSGLLEVYLNKKWGTVCIERFTLSIGDVICRQLGYTNAVSFGRYQPVDNERIVWLRDIQQCNTTATNLTCFKECYDPPIIRNIYCGNDDDVELECTFDESLADIAAGTENMCEIKIKEVHTAVIVLLILVFSIVFLTYMVLFIGRFITAAWHKSDRYKVQEPERRYQFSTYHEVLKKNSMQLSESGAFQLQKSLSSAGPGIVIQHVEAIKDEQEEDSLSD